MSSDKAINFLRGEVGKSVKLTVVRSGVANPIVFNIVREKIESGTMSCEMLDNGIAHISLRYLIIRAQVVLKNIDKLS
ncbi:hypothetical protein AGMMS49936_07650 [Endomicrobiia bacterium]|nr:hypothetical protein AGMMS49936_07650 [Endomicrobiia bacterium]